MTEEMRNFCLDNIDDLKLKDDGFDIDTVLEEMEDKELHVSSINPDEYKELLNGIDN